MGTPDTRPGAAARPSAAPRQLRAGEWVRVKSREEILATLDAAGDLEGLPFMPEMLAYCGRRLRVAKRAHKTCDPPNGLAGRRMRRAVHLEGVRCDGSAHGGCQAGCLLFWKDAWLEKAGTDAPARAQAPQREPRKAAGCTEEALVRATTVAPASPDEPPVFRCQSTRVEQATEPLAWWDPRQYIEDYASGNVGLRPMLAAFAFTVYRAIADAGLGIGSPMRWAYDRVQALRGGTPYPSRIGRIPNGAPTPAVKLDLRPGERVRVKDYDSILDTLNENCHNRGMYFDPEEVPFCGGTFEVLRRVERIVDEKTGRMRELKNDAIILKDVACLSRYARCRKFCPRGIYAYWREAWLERAE